LGYCISLGDQCRGIIQDVASFSGSVLHANVVSVKEAKKKRSCPIDVIVDKLDDITSQCATISMKSDEELTALQIDDINKSKRLCSTQAKNSILLDYAQKVGDDSATSAVTTTQKGKPTFNEFISTSNHADIFMVSRAGDLDADEYPKMGREQLTSRECLHKSQIHGCNPTEVVKPLSEQLMSREYLIKSCTMKPTLDKYYRVDDLNFFNVVAILLRENFLSYLPEEERCTYRQLSKKCNYISSEIERYLKIDFLPLREPRFDYANQEEVSIARVDMAAAAFIHFGLEPGMFVRFMGGEYTGANRDVQATLSAIKEHIEPSDFEHIRRILLQGAPAKFQLTESSESKMEHINNGNQRSLDDNPQKVKETINKEERYSHIICLPEFFAEISPYARVTPQGLVKNKRIVWDGSTKRFESSVVMNDVTPTDEEAEITFGETFMNLLVWIYNMRISFPLAIIFLAMADVKACFRFPRMHPDVVGAFSFIADIFFCLATSMVFGSTTSASSWEPFRRTIEVMTGVYYADRELARKLVQRHAYYLDTITWGEVSTQMPTRAFPCDINKGIFSALRAFMYVDDALMAAQGIEEMKMLLACCIEAIFVVMGRPDVKLRQCHLAMDKWAELVIKDEQTMLGINIDATRLTVGISREYRQQCLELLDSEWKPEKYYFTVHEAQVLVGKLARLGQGAHWVYHLMSHLYTSVAYAISENDFFLSQSSPRFQNYVRKIRRRQFNRDERPGKELRYALKQASNMVHRLARRYAMVKTMRAEIEFFREALQESSGIKWESPIALIIPRTPLGIMAGDSCLESGGGYSIPLRFIWNIFFPEEVVKRTLLHRKNNEDGKLISINVLEFVVVIINYCAAYTVITTEHVTDDPYPVMLNLVDNTSALNWLLHTCKSSKIGRLLARLFCGLLIGSPLGINGKFISSEDNEIADEISRMKKQACDLSSQTRPSFDFTSLTQKYKQLNVCRSFHPSPELISVLWDVVLNESLPSPTEIMTLRQRGLGKLTTSVGVGAKG
jgi:hypothetical protein